VTGAAVAGSPAVAAPPGAATVTLPDGEGVAQGAPEPAPPAPEQQLPPVNPTTGLPTADKPVAEQAAPGEEEDDKLPSGLSVSLSAGMNFGSATFLVDAGYVRNPMVGWSLGVSPAYSFPDSTRISASASINQELTTADGDDAPRTLLFDDISLSLGRPLYKFQDGPRLSGSLSASIPLSTASRVDSLITSLGAGLGAGQSFGKFGLSLGTSFRKNFHRYSHPTRNPNTGRNLVTRDGLAVNGLVTGLARPGGPELAGDTYFDGEANNTSMSLGGSIGASYSPTEKLGLGISYRIGTSWTYDSYALDETSSPYATEGRGRHDSQTGTLTANYRALDNLSFGLGMVTAGGFFSADNKSYRFPFYAFEGAESNLTTFFVNLTYTESIPL
jgi:hypothetical protein